MTRAQLEHILRAAGAITEESDEEAKWLREEKHAWRAHGESNSAYQDENLVS